MKLEDQFRQNLLGQLSDEKTEVDVTIASRIAREFTYYFVEFIKDNCIETPMGWQINGKEYLTEELLKIYEDGL